MQLALGISDIVMVGRLGTDELAAVGFAIAVIMVLIALFFGFNQAVNAIVARHIGAGEPLKASKAAYQSLLFVTYLGGVISVVSFLSAPRLIKFAALDLKVERMAIEYILIYAAFMVFIVYTFILNGIFQGMGRPKVQFYVMGGSIILNIILNFFFIFGDQYIEYIPVAGLGLGVAGAALATVIARTIAALVLIILLCGKRYPVRLRFGGFTLLKEYIKPLNIIGFPTGIQGIGRSVAMLLLYNAAAQTSIGKFAIGALTVGIQTEAVSFFPVLGMMFATTAMVGQNIGAGKIDRAVEATWKSVRISFIYMIPWALIYVLFPVQLVRVFTNEPGVIYPAATYLLVSSAFLVTLAVLPVFGTLRAAGDATVPMLINLFCLFVIRVGFAYLFLNFTNLDYMGIWWAMNISMIVECVLIFLRYRQGIWKKIKL